MNHMFLDRDVHVTKSRTHVSESGAHVTSCCTTIVHKSYILRDTHAKNCGAHITPHGAHIRHGAHVHESWCTPTVFTVTATSVMLRICVMVHIYLSPGAHLTETHATCMSTNHRPHTTRRRAHLLVTIIVPTHTPRNSGALMYMHHGTQFIRHGTSNETWCTYPILMAREGIRHMSTNSDARRLESWRT